MARAGIDPATGFGEYAPGLHGESRFARHVGRYQLIAVAVAGVATLAVSVVPALSFGYRSADLHVALETTASLVSALAASLLYGRFRRTRMLDELVLSAALAALTIANVIRAVTPAASDALQTEAVWVPLLAGLMAGATLTAAALVPRRPLARPERGHWLVLAAMAAVAAVAVAALLLSPHLGTGIDPTLSPASSHHPRLIGAPGVLACQFAGIVLCAVASIGFTIRARQSGDDLLAWIALGATIGACARLNYFLFPSGYSEWVFTGDFFRLAFYLLILIGAARQISAYERSAGELAVLEERRRIARDLQGGLARDLAFVSEEATSLAREDGRAEPLAVAADRALADSRGAIAALSSTEDEGLDVSVARLATDLTHRSDVKLRLELTEGIETSHDRREALLRILSESISSAIRDGSPSTLSIGLSWRPGLQRAGVRLTIDDDGAGVDPAEESRSGGLRLADMRKRVERLGGTVTVSARAGAGTEIDVSLP